MALGLIKAFTSASADVDSGADLSDAGVGIVGPKSEALRVMAVSTLSSVTATLRMSLVDTSGGDFTTVASYDATVASTARRTGNDGASGDWVASVSFAETSSSKFDLMGQGGAYSGPGDRYRWFLGCPALSGGTLTVYGSSSEQV